MRKSTLRVRGTILFCVALVGVMSTAVSGCSDGDNRKAADETSKESLDKPGEEPTIPGQEPLYTATYVPNGKEVAVLATSKGVVKLEFFSDAAPNHSACFVELSRKGFYDGVKFHRVIDGFVVQGGDPQTKEFTSAEVADIIARQSAGRYEPGEPILGTGGPGYRIAEEFNSRQHLEGTLAMARSNDPDSGGSQFYICLAPQPALDGNYTVFGEVIEGMDVVKTLVIGDEIESITVENATK